MMGAFVTYSVPGELTNEVDEVVCRALRTMINAAGRALGMSRRTGIERRAANEERLEAFQSFMISVGDQALISEMAILIAALARYRDITLYSVNVVVALGCLASTVHLALAPLLIRRMQDHHVTKALRCVSMAAAAILLATLLLLQLSKSWQSHVYFCCAVENFGFDRDYLYYNWLPIAWQILVLYLIIYSTYEIIQLLYSKPCGDAKSNAAGASSCAIAEMKDKSHDHFVHAYKTRSEKQKVRRQWLRYQARQAARPAKKSLRKQRLKAFTLAETWAFYECQGSFTWRILWLLSANIYGITDVLWSRADVGTISGDRDAMGYGQIVSLVLLVLPFFAAAESIYGWSPHATSSMATANAIADYRGRVKSLEDEIRMEVSRPPDAPGNAVEATTATKPSNSGSSASSRPSSSTDAAPSSHPQPRCTTDPPDSTPCGDGIAAIFRPPTIESLDADGRPLPAGVDGSLSQLAQETVSCGHMFFARLWTYVHALFMLALAILLGWAPADGPAVIAVVVYGVLGLIILRSFCGWICFSFFLRKIRRGKISDNDATEKPPAAEDQTSR